MSGFQISDAYGDWHVEPCSKWVPKWFQWSSKGFQNLQIPIPGPLEPCSKGVPKRFHNMEISIPGPLKKSSKSVPNHTRALESVSETSSYTGNGKKLYVPWWAFSVIRYVFRLEPISFHISSYPVLATYQTSSWNVRFGVIRLHLVFLFGESTRKTHWAFFCNPMCF